MDETDGIKHWLGCPVDCIRGGVKIGTEWSLAAKKQKYLEKILLAASPGIEHGNGVASNRLSSISACEVCANIK
jgi:hypothetical protein